MSRYIEVTASDIPSDARWDVSQRNQGQIVEVAYADYPSSAYEADAGAFYKRVTDRSDQSVTYYRRRA